MCVLQQEEDRQDSRLSGLQAVRGTSARPLERQVGLARWRLESKAPVQVIEWNEYMLTERGSIPEAAEPSHHVGWFLNCQAQTKVSMKGSSCWNVSGREVTSCQEVVVCKMRVK